MIGDPFKVLFYLRKAKTNSRGLAPLQCRLTYNKKRCEFSTAIFINYEDWDSKTQLIISKSNKVRSLNNQLQLISQLFLQHFNTLLLTNKPFDVNDVYNSYKGNSLNKVVYVLEFMSSYLSKLESLVNIDIKRSTWKKYENAYLNISNYINKILKVSDVKINELDILFIRNFELYLKTKKRFAQATINKILQRLKRVVFDAYQANLIEKNPFNEYKFILNKKPIVYLDEDELIRIETVNLESATLSKVRDMFVFCCYTGLAYSEMSSLKKSNITKGFDTKHWIKIVREKTGKVVNIPLLPKAMHLIDKYSSVGENILPKISNQKFNVFIKEVADKANIEKCVTHHTARKTFASTILLYNDVSMEVVSELLGHSSIKVTQECYAHLCNRKISDTMLRLSRVLK